MVRPRLLIKPTPEGTRLLMVHWDTEVLRAVLLAPPRAHRQAAATLCEGLSLWFQQPLSVVLYADAQGTSSALGLCDDIGFGLTTVHYEVEVVDPARRRRPMGPFRDLRQLDLRGVR